MPLSRTERFKLKSQIFDAMDANRATWNFQRMNLLLNEFGFSSVDGNYDGPGFEDLIAAIADSDLLEMYSIVTGLEPDDAIRVPEPGEIGNWKPGYVRLFLSHSAESKDLVSEVAEELAVVGIHGFVAHDALAYSTPWQAQIEQALRTAQLFVAIADADSLKSAWCHQEIGWALGSGMPVFVIRAGVAPTGFISREQWPNGHDLSALRLADLISTWASAIPEIGDTMTDGLFTALEGVGNYIDAGATAKRIAALSGLDESQWARLDQIYWSNNQVSTGLLPNNALRPFYQQHMRAWPPARVTQVGAAASGTSPF